MNGTTDIIPMVRGGPGVNQRKNDQEIMIANHDLSHGTQPRCRIKGKHYCTNQHV